LSSNQNETEKDEKSFTGTLAEIIFFLSYVECPSTGTSPILIALFFLMKGFKERKKERKKKNYNLFFHPVKYLK